MGVGDTAIGGGSETRFRGHDLQLGERLLYLVELTRGVGVLLPESGVLTGETTRFLKERIASFLEFGNLTKEVVSLSDEGVDFVAMDVFDRLETGVERFGDSILDGGNTRRTVGGFRAFQGRKGSVSSRKRGQMRKEDALVLA